MAEASAGPQDEPRKQALHQVTAEQAMTADDEVALAGSLGCNACRFVSSMTRIHALLV